jgi:hypothetical protein
LAVKLPTRFFLLLTFSPSARRAGVRGNMYDTVGIEESEELE